MVVHLHLVTLSPSKGDPGNVRGEFMVRQAHHDKRKSPGEVPELLRFGEPKTTSWLRLSSCRRRSSSDPCACARWSWCAGREPAGRDGDGCRGSSRCPS